MWGSDTCIFGWVCKRIPALLTQEVNRRQGHLQGDWALGPVCWAIPSTGSTLAMSLEHLHGLLYLQSGFPTLCHKSTSPTTTLYYLWVNITWLSIKKEFYSKWERKRKWSDKTNKYWAKDYNFSVLILHTSIQCVYFPNLKLAHERRWAGICFWGWCGRIAGIPCHHQTYRNSWETRCWDPFCRAKTQVLNHNNHALNTERSRLLVKKAE